MRDDRRLKGRISGEKYREKEKKNASRVRSNKTVYCFREAA